MMKILLGDGYYRLQRIKGHIAKLAIYPENFLPVIQAYTYNIADTHRTTLVIFDQRQDAVLPLT
ncbi:hypothetical protein Plhal703r1_c53g0158331 [Plasmopara halstedii]